jgi:type II secretory pathway component PulJ
MENIRLSRATYQLIERAVTALECIGRELERYNDRHERTGGEDTGETNPGES